MNAADVAVVERWWAEFAATGRLPADLSLVQGRLVRRVHRGKLPSGDVYVKEMTFPRTKDRLRYLLRPLPARHEAVMLGAAAAAGIPCPDVVAVHTRRRAAFPSRSMLVLAALATAPPAAGREVSLREEAEVAARLLDAGIVHRDLHSGNFVRLADGRVAVLDLQSARPGRGSRRRRVGCAGKLLQNRADVTRADARSALLGSSLLRSDDEVEQALRIAAVERRRFLRARVLRCWSESTEFTRRFAWWGVEHRTRGELPAGRWWSAGAGLRAAWIGQRALHVLDGRPPTFPAFAAKWWWLGGGASLYVPAACSDERIEAEVQAAVAGHARFLALPSSMPRKPTQ